MQSEESSLLIKLLFASVDGELLNYLVYQGHQADALEPSSNYSR